MTSSMHMAFRTRQTLQVTFWVKQHCLEAFGKKIEGFFSPFMFNYYMMVLDSNVLLIESAIHCYRQMK